MTRPSVFFSEKRAGAITPHCLRTFSGGTMTAFHQMQMGARRPASATRKVSSTGSDLRSEAHALQGRWPAMNSKWSPALIWNRHFGSSDIFARVLGDSPSI